MRRPRMTVQQQDDVTEFQPRPFQVSLHVLHQRRAYVDRLVGVDSGRRLLFASHDLHDERGGEMLELLGHDHLIKVRLLHHKVKAMLLSKRKRKHKHRYERQVMKGTGLILSVLNLKGVKSDILREFLMEFRDANLHLDFSNAALVMRRRRQTPRQRCQTPQMYTLHLVRNEMTNLVKHTKRPTKKLKK